MTIICLFFLSISPTKTLTMCLHSKNSSVLSYLVFERPLLQVSFIVTRWQLVPLSRGSLCHHEEFLVSINKNLCKTSIKAVQWDSPWRYEHSLLCRTKARVWTEAECRKYLSVTTMTGGCVLAADWLIRGVGGCLWGIHRGDSRLRTQGWKPPASQLCVLVFFFFLTGFKGNKNRQM